MIDIYEKEVDVGDYVVYAAVSVGLHSNLSFAVITGKQWGNKVSLFTQDGSGRFVEKSMFYHDKRFMKVSDVPESFQEEFKTWSDKRAHK